MGTNLVLEVIAHPIPQHNLLHVLVHRLDTRAAHCGSKLFVPGKYFDCPR